MIEKQIEGSCTVRYRIDPQEHKIVCPLEPCKPYEETICHELETGVEEFINRVMEYKSTSCKSKPEITENYILNKLLEHRCSI